MPKVSKKKEGCTNCGRPLGLVGGLCYTCRKTAMGLNGPAKAKAPQAAKRRIDAGEVVRGGKVRKKQPVKAHAAAQRPGFFVSASEKFPTVPLRDLVDVRRLAGDPDCIERISTPTSPQTSAPDGSVGPFIAWHSTARSVPLDKRDEEIRAAVLVLADVLADLVKGIREIRQTQERP